MAEQDDVLPSYHDLPLRRGASAPSTIHTFSLANSKGKPWLILRLRSYAGDPKSSPIYVSRSRITGEVELDLDKRESIKSLAVMVLGATTAVGSGPDVFLKMEKVLWDAKQRNAISSGSLPSSTSSSDPPSLPIHLSGAQGQNPTQSDLRDRVRKVLNPNTATMTGKIQIPFEFHALPAEVAVPGVPKQYPTSYPLPPRFVEKTSLVHVDYSVVVSVKKGWLDAPSKLPAMLAYIPLETAPPPPLLRQIAYEEAQQELLGPEIDPEGWKVLPSVSFKAKLFSALDVEINCTLAIAKPLTYALNTQIPLHMTLESTNSQALDVITQPASPVVQVHLVRAAIAGPDALLYPLGDGTQRKMRRLTDRISVFKSIDQAYFWNERVNQNNESGPDTPVRDPEGKPKIFKKVLHGEITLGKTVKPSFVFPSFSVLYQLDVLPFDIPGFVPSRPPPSQSPILISEPITIVTLPAPGCLSKSLGPPRYYEAPTTRGNYEKAIGMWDSGPLLVVSQRGWSFSD